MYCFKSNSITDESQETTAFLTLLSTWDKQELEQKLGQRVEFSKRAIGKLLQAFDRLLQRNDRLQQALRDQILSSESEKINDEKSTVSNSQNSTDDIKKEKTDSGWYYLHFTLCVCIITFPPLVKKEMVLKNFLKVCKYAIIKYCHQDEYLSF